MEESEVLEEILTAMEAVNGPVTEEELEEALEKWPK